MGDNRVMASGQFKQLRCSDADREQLVDELRRHAGDGRLTLTELDERIEQAYAAKTFSDLEILVRDLPSATPLAAPMPQIVKPKNAKYVRPLGYRLLNYVAIDIACVVVWAMTHLLNGNWSLNDFWPAWVIGATFIMFMFKVVGTVERRHRAEARAAELGRGSDPFGRRLRP